MRMWILPLSIAALLFCYFVWLRPALSQREEIKEFYAGLDSFWLSIWVRIRSSWLMIVAVISAIAPEIPGWLTELQLLDLSMILPSEWAFRASKIIAILAVIARIYVGVSVPKPMTDPEVK